MLSFYIICGLVLSTVEYTFLEADSFSGNVFLGDKQMPMWVAQTQWECYMYLLTLSATDAQNQFGTDSYASLGKMNFH